MISFVVIGKNEGWRLEKCLASIHQVIAKDGINDWEIVYVDSKSIDESINIAKRYDARPYLITGECNAAIARNIGAKEARGEVLFFIDGDMEIMAGFLPQVMNETGTLIYPFVSGIFNDIEYDKCWNYIRTTRRHKLREGNPDSVEVTTGGLFLITRVLWEQLGGMDNRLRRSQDYDFGLRMAEVNIPLHRKAILLANHYMVQYVVRNDYILNSKYTALLFRKHWKNSHYLSLFIKQNYTAMVLLMMIVLSWLFPWSWLAYLSVLLYKNIKQKNQIQYYWRLFARDVVLLFSIIGYYPDYPTIEYKSV